MEQLSIPSEQPALPGTAPCVYCGHVPTEQFVIEPGFTSAKRVRLARAVPVCQQHRLQLERNNP